MLRGMKHFDEDVANQIEAAVGELETGTTVEVVVRIVPQATSYRSVRLLWALGLALVGLAVLIYSPYQVAEHWLFPNVLICAGLGYLWGGLGFVIRLSTSQTKRHEHALQHAQADFVKYAVDATRARTGCLVFVSVLEEDIVLHLDHGVHAAAPEAVWGMLEKTAREGKGPIEHRLSDLLTAMAPVMAEHLPADNDDNPDELSNRPIIG